MALALSRSRVPLVYALHSGQLYGTERMALATALELRDAFAATIFAPPGPALEEAVRLGLGVQAFRSAGEFARGLRPLLARSRRLAFLSTRVMCSLVCGAWNLVYRRDVRHLHVVHGGAGDHDSYGRKRRLGRGVTFVAVSAYVRDRLVAHGVPAAQAVVIENFLPGAAAGARPSRGPFRVDGVRRVSVVSRLDPAKRIDLLVDALARTPELGELEVTVYGDGPERPALERRARAAAPGIRFAGFRTDVDRALAGSDALVHLCPTEPFGLAVLEGMAAGLPVLVPDRGGAATLVAPGLTGFTFRADDAGDLAARLAWLRTRPAEDLNGVVAAARHVLGTRFCPTRRAADYRKLLEGAA